MLSETLEFEDAFEMGPRGGSSYDSEDSDYEDEDLDEFDFDADIEEIEGLEAEWDVALEDDNWDENDLENIPDTEYEEDEEDDDY